MRVFVTGARGFVGRHLTAHLAELGDEVVGVDRECDVTDLPAVVGAMAAAAPDAVVHLAARASVAESWRAPEEYVRVNVLGTRNVVEAAVAAAPSATVLFVSSADVYGVVGEADLPLVESRRPQPSNPYAQSKFEAELLVRALARETGQAVIVARPFNHVGPGQSEEFVLPALVRRLLDARASGARSIPVGDLRARRDFSDVRDVVRAYRLLLALGAPGEVYHVASGQDVAIGDVARLLVERIAPDVALEEDPTLRRPVEVPVLRGSFQKIHEATGWEPTIALARSLDDLIGEMATR